MHSGALKFDKGNLFVCLEKKWERVKLISPSQTKNKQKDYGFHKENPGTSCNDILAKAGGKILKNGIYWIKESSTPRGSATLRVYCDMETGPGGWTMVFKLNGRRNTESTMTYRQIFEDPRGVEENNAEVLSTKWNKDISGYKSRIMTRMFFFTFNASKAKIVLYKKDKSLQKDLLFNAKSSDMAAWFRHTKLTSSVWNDIKNTRFTGADRNSVFSSWYHGQLFFIAKKEINENCEGKEGWLQIIDHGGRCANFPIKGTPGIYYSKKETATLWSKAGDVGEADVLVIFLQ